MSRRALFCLGSLLVGCNAVSGVDDIEVVEGDLPATSGAGAGTPGATSGGGAAGGGDVSTGAGAGAGAGATVGTGGMSTTGSGAGGSQSPCPPCGANEQCEESTGLCVCDPGFIVDGGSCVPAPAGDPATRTEQEVCDAWAAGHVVTDPNPHSASGADCDPGTLSQAGLNDTLVRINMFRWLNGLDPVSDDEAFNDMAQACANLEAWWTFSGGNAHNPPSTAKCYTALGAQGAGSSNIAWGSNHPATAIDQFMRDNGNETTMGHRRWIIHPPLGKVGIGYWETGGIYGNAQCLRVFDSSGGGPNPSWSAVPNQGFVPLTVAQWTWTFHGSLGGIPNADVSVLRVGDNTSLPVTILPLNQGFGQPATSWEPDGWTVQAGETYRVTISNLSGPDVQYDVKPVSCN